MCFLSAQGTPGAQEVEKVIILSASDTRLEGFSTHCLVRSHFIQPICAALQFRPQDDGKEIEMPIITTLKKREDEKKTLKPTLAKKELQILAGILSPICRGCFDLSHEGQMCWSPGGISRSLD